MRRRIGVSSLRTGRRLGPVEAGVGPRRGPADGGPQRHLGGADSQLGGGWVQRGGAEARTRLLQQRVDRACERCMAAGP